MFGRIWQLLSYDVGIDLELATSDVTGFFRKEVISAREGLFVGGF